MFDSHWFSGSELDAGPTCPSHFAQAFRRVVGVTPTDPLTFAAVFALVGATALVAAYAPARRVAHIDPVRILRQD